MGRVLWGKPQSLTQMPRWQGLQSRIFRRAPQRGTPRNPSEAWSRRQPLPSCPTYAHLCFCWPWWSRWSWCSYVRSWSPVPPEICTAPGAATWAPREVSCRIFIPNSVKLLIALKSYSKSLTVSHSVSPPVCRAAFRRLRLEVKQKDGLIQLKKLGKITALLCFCWHCIFQLQFSFSIILYWF